MSASNQPRWSRVPPDVDSDDLDDRLREVHDSADGAAVRDSDDRPRRFRALGDADLDAITGGFGRRGRVALPEGE